MAVHRGGETAGPQRLASYDEAMEQVTVSASPANNLARRMRPRSLAAAGAGRLGGLPGDPQPQRRPDRASRPAPSIDDRPVVPGVRTDARHLPIDARTRRRGVELQRLHPRRTHRD